MEGTNIEMRFTLVEKAISRLRHASRSKNLRSYLG